MTTRNPAEPCLGKFAFLIHPMALEDLYTSGPAGFCHLSSHQRQNWEQWIASWSARHYEPGIAYHLPAIHSQAGGYAEGWLISIPLTPEQMMRLKPRDRQKLMNECVELARDLGVDMLGLGAFTSIVTRNGTDLAGCGVNITTGNSLTAMIAAESLKLAARRRGCDLSRASTGVVGAAGSVGRLACKHLAAACGDLTLFGNPANRSSLQKLKAVAGELYRDAILRLLEGSAPGFGDRLLPIMPRLQEASHPALTDPGNEAYCRLYDHVEACFARVNGARPPITLTVDLEHRLPHMQFVISATSQGKAFIDAPLLRSGAVVCDAARPADVHADLHKSRPDVFVYEGGLVRLPEPVAFGSRNVIGCKAGINLACLSETMVLTMAGIRRDYSVGVEMPLEEAREVWRLACQHGFQVFLPEEGESIRAGHPLSQTHTSDNLRSES